MQYYIDRIRKKENTAGDKAPADIARICESMGMKRFEMPIFPENRGKLYQKLWIIVICMWCWIRLIILLRPSDVVFYQHPMYGNRILKEMIPRIKKRKKCKFVAVIHDLESLRKGVEGLKADNRKTNQIADGVLLKYFDKIICHNKYMKQYLMGNGFDESKLITLDIFDYLGKSTRKQSAKSRIPSCAVAGNLSKGKCGYIYKIFDEQKNGKNQTLQMHLYGSYYEKGEECSNVIYHGSFGPEELPEYLEGDFGLVWDGASVSTCTGNTGEYLRFNNPHKVSLYLSSNMPVIVWREAAIADFILENGVGLVADNLYELEDVIKNITIEEYSDMCKNVEKISNRLHGGYYFRRAVEKCLTGF